MDKVLLIIPILYGMFNIAHTVAYLSMWKTDKPNLLPQDLKKATKMNWVGCSICSLLLFLVFPLTYLIRVIDFLFHI